MFMIKCRNEPYFFISNFIWHHKYAVSFFNKKYLLTLIFFLLGLANVLKLEGQRRNILINVIAPLAASRLTEDILPPEILEKSKPEYVSPIVTYLCSEQCQENGSIFNVGLGKFSRSAMMTGPGWLGGSEVTADDIMENFDKIYVVLNDFNTF